MEWCYMMLPFTWCKRGERTHTWLATHGHVASLTPFCLFNCNLLMIHPSAFAGSLLSLCWHPLFCLLEASHRRRHPTTACTAAHPQCIDLGLIIIFGANLGVIITYNNHWTIDDQTSSYFPTRNYRHRWILGTGFILSRMNVDPWVLQLIIFTFLG